MYTLIVIGLSVILQLISIVLSIRLLKVAKSKTTWILMAFAFALLTVKWISDFSNYITDIANSSGYPVFFLLDVIISILFIIGLIKMRKILGNLYNSDKALVASEKRFKALFNNSSDEIFIADFNGNFLEVNQEACDKLGYSKEAFLKMNFRDIKTPKYINMVQVNINAIMKHGKHIYETEHVSKDKKIIFLEMNSRVVDYEDGSAILTIARDITERKEYERRILSAIIDAEERERRRFAKEMHDGVGPLLSTVKMYVNELGSDEIKQPEKETFVTYTNELIDDAISNIRTISNNLMPTLISEYGLVKAIESFCKKINTTGKITINFKSQNYTDKLEPNLELVFFRVTEELINNSMKHSGAKQIWISLEITNKKLVLAYADNGVGFDFNEINNNSKTGMGLKNIESRVKTVNAHYQFGKNTDGTGFSFKAEADIS